jgi:hypothetical protein
VTSLPLASVSLDLDDLWTYMKSHGDPGWESRPSYLGTFGPIILEQLDLVDTKITFFLVGSDVARVENQRHFEALATAGHEMGNHSYEHDTWLHLHPEEHLEKDILRAHEVVHAVTGLEPVGFRGPGFTWSPTLLRVLARHYAFDASTLPTYLGPLARAYYLWSTDLSKEERRRRGKLFGGFRDGLRPVKPYYWPLQGGESLLEIPVTTIPVIKSPFHMSYLLYLGRFSESLMDAYLSLALGLCRLTSTEPSFLLHPLDVLGAQDVPQLAFFPGMDMPRERKLRLFRKVLERLKSHFQLVPMSRHADSIARSLAGERSGSGVA